MWQAEYRLYLYPTDSNKKISQKRLESALQEIEFIGDLLNAESDCDEDYRYKVGEEFLSLICFMGCSPNIEMEPQEDSPFCYVEISSETNAMRLVAGDNLKKINCPHCKKPQLALANKLLNSDAEALFSQHCTVCKELIDPSKINWRKSAFVASSWVLLGNIYESEAVPDEKLLLALEQASACEWRYAYVRCKAT